MGQVGRIVDFIGSTKKKSEVILYKFYIKMFEDKSAGQQCYRYKNMNIYEKWLLGDTSVVILLNSMTHYCKMV